MEETESTMVEKPTGESENQKLDETLLLSSKPLHRFVQKQPRNFGVNSTREETGKMYIHIQLYTLNIFLFWIFQIVILMFGCAEIVMGCAMAGTTMETSFKMYTPFWQGTLVCMFLNAKAQEQIFNCF